MTTQEQQKRPIEEARERLKTLSLEVKDLVEDGTFFTINDAIMETLYRDESNSDFKSYRAWRKAGFQVRKGEKAFLLWARPKDIKRPAQATEPSAETDIEKMMKYFPLAYLFSNAQVDPIGASESQSEPAPEHADELEPLPY